MPENEKLVINESYDVNEDEKSSSNNAAEKEKQNNEELVNDINVVSNNNCNDDGKFSNALSKPELSRQAGMFRCTLCKCSRKTQFRLLQHYSVTHFRTQLEDQFGLQFVTNNGCCPVCRKIMKNLYCFLIHIGAAHGEVAKFIDKGNGQLLDIEQDRNESLISINQLSNTWRCPAEMCHKSEFPNKCFLMRHYAKKHHHLQLAAVLGACGHAKAWRTGKRKHTDINIVYFQ